VNYKRWGTLVLTGCVCGSLVIAAAWLYFQRPWLYWNQAVSPQPTPPPVENPTWEQRLDCSKHMPAVQAQPSKNLKKVANAEGTGSQMLPVCDTLSRKEEQQSLGKPRQGENIHALMQQFKAEWNAFQKNRSRDVPSFPPESYEILEQKIVWYSRKDILPLKKVFSSDENVEWSINLLESMLELEDGYRPSLELLLERLKKADRLQEKVFLVLNRNLDKRKSVYYGQSIIPECNKPWRLAQKNWTIQKLQTAMHQKLDFHTKNFFAKLIHFIEPQSKIPAPILSFYLQKHTDFYAQVEVAEYLLQIDAAAHRKLVSKILLPYVATTHMRSGPLFRVFWEASPLPSFALSSLSKCLSLSANSNDMEVISDLKENCIALVRKQGSNAAKFIPELRRVILDSLERREKSLLLKALAALLEVAPKEAFSYIERAFKFDDFEFKVNILQMMGSIVDIKSVKINNFLFQAIQQEGRLRLEALKQLEKIKPSNPAIADFLLKESDKIIRSKLLAKTYVPETANVNKRTRDEQSFFEAQNIDFEAARKMLIVASVHFAKPLEKKSFHDMAKKIGDALAYQDLPTWQPSLCSLKYVSDK
jgi:hypothetical protein